MGTTISGSQGPIVLDGTLQTNPVLVTGTITDTRSNLYNALHGLANQVWDITNQGTIVQSGSLGTGVSLDAGGNLNNSGFISGTNDGVANINNLTNSGTIIGTVSFGVDGGSGGTITNQTGGLLTGASAIRTGATLVSNAGTIAGTNGYGLRVFGTSGLVTNTNGAVIEGITAPNSTGFGIQFISAGTVVNGDSSALTALVRGTEGIDISGTGTVANFGAIVGTASSGIFIGAGGIVNNGDAGATGRSITGVYRGIYIQGGLGTVSNFGTIVQSATGGFHVAVGLKGGGDLVNGSSASPGWLIHGANDGVGGATNITNYGAIVGDASFGVDGGSGGTITNAKVGLITGANAVRTGATLVSNAGTMVGTNGYGLRVFGTDGLVTNANGALIEGIIAPNSTGFGIQFTSAGTVVNGDSSALTALVRGTEGIDISGTGTVANFGAIVGTASSGIFIGAGGIVNNGDAGATGRSITGIYRGIYIQGGLGTVSNFGTIVQSTTGGGNVAVGLKSGGDVVNGSSASPGWLIQGANDGVAGATNITNYGAIIGAASFGVDGGSGGAILNAKVGLIAGANAVRAGATLVSNAGTMVGTVGYGLRMFGTTGAVTNTGLIQGIINPGSTGFGVQFDASGTLVNGSSVAKSALIIGTNGVVAGGAAAVTVTNFGTIAGTAGLAVSFGSGDDRLIVEPGAMFSGGVDGAAGANTLELAAGSGKLLGLGTSFVNFGSVAFDNGGAWSLEGSTAALSATITGFVAADTIDVEGFVAIGQSYTGGGLVLTDAVSNTVTIGIQGVFTTADFTISSDGHGGTNITTPLCFCRGTLILCERGEVAVEDLEVGDRVRTLSGSLERVIWIGMGRDLVTRANRLARPVIVRRGALADNVPKRDLYLTHGHALYLDSAIGGVLIPVENLINHHSILWDERAQAVEYYHIELANHDVLLAEGAPAESYYDAENRALFHNTRPGSIAGGEKPSFAPVMSGGDLVDRVWAELFARSGAGSQTDMTDDPDLHLVVDGARVDAQAIGGAAYNFSLAGPPAGPVRLCSRSGVPSLVGITRHDHRRLGVAIARLEIRQPGIVTTIDHDAPVLAEAGCYPAEHGYCWTDGEAVLPASLFEHLGGPLTVRVHTERPGMRYALATPIRRAA